MNDVTKTKDTGLALPNTRQGIEALFASPNSVDDILARIESKVRSHAPDLSTAKGRTEIRSLAAHVSSSKVALDTAGKELNAAMREKIDAVDAERRKIRERLDALRDEARRPLTEWERAEEQRKAAIEARIAKLGCADLSTDSTSDVIAARLAEIEATEIDDSFQEFRDDADFARDTALSQLRMILSVAEKREADARELERLRAEAAERERRDAEERAAREAAEAAERQKREEAARAARLEAEKREMEERARRDADERAAAAIAQREAEAKEKLKQERARAAQRVAKLKAQAEQAAAQERAKIEAERLHEAEQARLRAEDEEQRAKVRESIVSALKNLRPKTLDEFANLIMEGKLPHVRVEI